jgi:uncharacterized membrane protein
MSILISGLVLFIGVHLLREFSLRDAAIARLGVNYYRLAYSLIAVIGLGLIIWGKSSAPFVMLYQPKYEFITPSHIAMLPAFVLVMAGNLPVSHIRRHTVHPMLIGTAIWGGAHLWANGDLASVLLFGSIGLWAIIKFFSLLKVKPLAAKTASFTWDVVAIFLGFCLYGLVLVYHGQLFGIGLTLG